MDELNQIFEDLRAAGIVRTKKEFADALGINYTGLIAMKTLEQNDRLIALLELEARMRTGFSPGIAEGKNARSAEE